MPAKARILKGRSNQTCTKHDRQEPWPLAVVRQRAQCGTWMVPTARVDPFPHASVATIVTVYVLAAGSPPSFSARTQNWSPSGETAQSGAVSLIINAPASSVPGTPEGDRDAMIAAVVALRRAAWSGRNVSAFI